MKNMDVSKDSPELHMENPNNLNSENPSFKIPLHSSMYRQGFTLIQNDITVQ